jgi:hypothetical protein
VSGVRVQLIPTGTVTFMDGAVAIATDVPLVGKKAAFTTNALIPGIHAITAIYSGDADFNGSISPVRILRVRQAGTLTQLTSSLNPSQLGNPVTFTATVSTAASGLGIPTGTITFRDGHTILGVAALDGAGHATYTTAALSRGRHSITAVYSGDTNSSGSTARLKQLVQIPVIIIP